VSPLLKSVQLPNTGKNELAKATGVVTGADV